MSEIWRDLTDEVRQSHVVVLLKNVNNGCVYVYWLRGATVRCEFQKLR